MLVIYYNRHNYMFRPLMLAIFRLYRDNVPDHSPTTDTDAISVPHKKPLSQHPKKKHAVLLDKFMYNLKMANVSGRNM